MSYIGYNTRGSNVLCVYVAAEGYDSGIWLDPLQYADKCGFNMQYIDPENLRYCTITLEAQGGAVSPSSLTCIQQKRINEIPDPHYAPPDSSLYFQGWYT